MRNFRLPLRPELHHKFGDKTHPIEFSLGRNVYRINDEEFAVPFKSHLDPSFEGYTYEVLNRCVLVTLFFKEDILRVH